MVCAANGIEPKGVILGINPDRIEENAKFVRENYGEQFVDRMILSQSPARLREVLPYLEETGNIHALLTGSAGILSLTLDEIKEREEVLRREGEEIIVDGKFHPIFGQSKKKYEKYHGVIVDAIRSEKEKVSNK